MLVNLRSEETQVRCILSLLRERLGWWLLGVTAWPSPLNLRPPLLSISSFLGSPLVLSCGKRDLLHAHHTAKCASGKTCGTNCKILQNAPLQSGSVVGFSDVLCFVSFLPTSSPDIFYTRNTKESHLPPAWFPTVPRTVLVLYLEAEPGIYGNTARVEGR